MLCCSILLVFRVVSIVVKEFAFSLVTSLVNDACCLLDAMSDRRRVFLSFRFRLS